MELGDVSGRAELNALTEKIIGDAIEGHRNGQAEKVMNGLFELLGESDPLSQTYRQQMTAIAGG